MTHLGMSSLLIASPRIARRPTCSGTVLPPDSSPADRYTVLCGIDAGPNASRVIAVASMLAFELPARLVLAHVASDPHVPGSAAVPGAAAELREHELRRSRALLELELASVPEDVTVDCRVVFGDPSHALQSLGRAEAADLIVVGCRRRGALASAVLGSVSSHLVREADRPVVVVPEPRGDEAAIDVQAPEDVDRGYPGRELHGSPDCTALAWRRG